MTEQICPKQFDVIVIGIIFNPSTKKVLIGKRDGDPYLKKLTWCFPGGRVIQGEDIDKSLKKEVKKKTGYGIKNLGAFFTETFQDRPNLLAVYFLTQVFEGGEKAGDGIKELKWVSPKELDKYFTHHYHRKLKQFMEDLV